MSEASHFRGFDFTGTDWGETNRAIAARIGADENLVAAARRHFGMVVRERADWTQVDWNLTNRELAEQLGVHESTVSRQRTLAGCGTGGIDWDEADWSLTDREIAAQLGCSAAAVGKARRRITGQSSRQRGRPKKTETAVSRVVRVNLTEKEFSDLCAWAENADMTPEGAAALIVANAVKGEAELEK